MTRKRFITGFLLAAGLAVGIACTQPAPASPTRGTSTDGTATGVQDDDSGSPVGGGGPSFAGSGVVEAGGYATFAAPRVNGGVRQSGIWVGGSGKVTVTPDLATITVGVESTRDTVEAARQEAAEAMAAVMEVMDEHGIPDEDIRTRFFNIQPRHTWNDRERRQELTGYRVTNTVSVKTSDLDKVGRLVDDTAAAAGDRVRISGINFSTEDPGALTARAREAAVRDAMAKARQFAELTGVTLGKLAYIAETGGSAPVPRAFERVMALEAGAADSSAPTPVSPGQMEVSVTVQAVFDIE